MTVAAGARGPYRGVLFDLFGTLVFFAQARVSTAWAAGAANTRLESALAAELPDVARAEFVDAVRAVSREIVHQRRDSHAECSSAERFRRVLAQLGVRDDQMAERLCLAHMSGLAEVTATPPDYVRLLRRLGTRFRLGLVSNFDHAPTARAILSRHRLEPMLDPVIISHDFGWRKPRPDIFLHAVAALGLPASEVLFVGDTPLDDIDGARRAGLDAAWLNPGGELFPEGLLPPTLIVSDVAELCDALGM